MPKQGYGFRNSPWLHDSGFGGQRNTAPPIYFRCCYSTFNTNVTYVRMNTFTKKNDSTRTYLYLVEAVRSSGKVHQMVVEPRASQEITGKGTRFNHRRSRQVFEETVAPHSGEGSALSATEARSFSGVSASMVDAEALRRHQWRCCSKPDHLFHRQGCLRHSPS